MEKILAEVKSPFTDEKIKELILLFLEQEGDSKGFYRLINNVDIDAENQEMKKFNSELYRNSGDKYQVRHNDFWMNVRGAEVIEDLDFDYYRYRGSNHYRVYLNLPEDKRESFIKQYMVACEEQGVPLNFKFSLTDKRCDQLVIMCPCEDKEQFKKIIKIVELLTVGIDLGPLPEMVGEYKEKIGIVEARKTYSYTEDVINMLRIAISLSIIENSDKLKELTEDSRLIDTIDILKEFHFDDIECLNIRGGDDRGPTSDMVNEMHEHSRELFNLFRQLIQREPTIIENIVRDFKNIARIDWHRSEDIIFGSNAEKLMNKNEVKSERNGNRGGSGEDR